MPGNFDTIGSRSPRLSRRAFVRGSGTLLAASGGSSLLAACGAKEPLAGTVTFLNIVDFTSLTFSPEILADAGGYFADQGLKVRFERTRGSAQAIQLVLADSAPLTRVGQIEAIGHAANRGVPIMNIGTLVKKSTLRFISASERPLREPRDFEGKLFGIPSEGGESEITLDLFLATSGIDPASVKRQVVGYTPGIFSLVEEGRIDAYVVSIDTAHILAEQRPNVVTLNPGQFISSGAQCYLTSVDTSTARIEDLRKYLEAIKAAVEFMIDDDGFDETLRIMRTKYSFDSLLKDDVAKASLAEYVDAWTAEGRDNVLRTVPSTWQRGYEELVSVGQAAAGKDPASWFTNDLLPRT
jgi:NitT/TauT family transport system substrate-binding protein